MIDAPDALRFPALSCLYTELAKSYFLLGLFMAGKNTNWIQWICEEMSMIESFYTIQYLVDLEREFYDF